MGLCRDAWEGEAGFVWYFSAVEPAAVFVEFREGERMLSGILTAEAVNGVVSGHKPELTVIEDVGGAYRVEIVGESVGQVVYLAGRVSGAGREKTLDELLVELRGLLVSAFGGGSAGTEAGAAASAATNAGAKQGRRPAGRS